MKERLPEPLIHVMEVTTGQGIEVVTEETETETGTVLTGVRLEMSLTRKSPAAPTEVMMQTEIIPIPVVFMIRERKTFH